MGSSINDPEVGLSAANGKEKSPIGFPITRDFLEFAFEKLVKSFSVKVGSNVGDNYMSIMHAVEIEFGGDEHQNQEAQHYLIKCYPNHPTRREMLDQSHIFEKELFMYQDFLPALEKVVKDSEADAEIVCLSLAPFHGGNVSSSPSKKWKDTQWATENFIIMTDIRKCQFSMADRSAGLNMEEATLVVEEMARWHALAWAYKEKNGWSKLSDKHPSLVDPLYSNDKMTEEFKIVIDQVNRNSVKMTEELLGANHPAHLALQKATTEGDVMKIIKKFVIPHDMSEDDYEGMLRVKPEVDEEYSKEPWLTGTHGDCWMNNMLFRYDPDIAAPVEVTFIDLQMYRETCPTVDLAYFLSSSVRAPIRIPGKDKLLQAYHDGFLLSCHELSVKPFPGFSFNSLKRRYRRTELFGLLLGLTMLTFVLKPAEEAVDLDDSKDEKEDVSEMFSKVLVGSDKNSKFKEELMASVLDLYETGVI